MLDFYCFYTGKFMKIAIDASRAALHERTGIEEYSYQIIKHLRGPLAEHAVTLYVRSGTSENIDFELPLTWRVKSLWAPKFWTYVRLSWSLLWGRYDRLFVPGHIVPPIHPKHTIAVIHGLEYEKFPEAYSKKEVSRMRMGIKRTCRWARRLIAVSNNTKRDVMELYGVPKKKIRVVYEGLNQPTKISDIRTANLIQEFGLIRGQYIVFIGRLEARKNLVNVLKAYEMFREHFGGSHKLVLAGKPGFGAEEIEEEIGAHPFRGDIVITGFVGEETKWALLHGAAVFVFPSLYEGFGLPVLEAQQLGVPVVASNTSSLKEIGKDATVQVDPLSPQQIAQGLHEMISNADARGNIVAAGAENIKKFNWNRAAELTAKVILAGKD